MHLSTSYDHTIFRHAVLETISDKCSALLGLIEKKSHRLIYINKKGALMLGYEEPDCLLGEEFGKFLSEPFNCGRLCSESNGHEGPSVGKEKELKIITREGIRIPASIFAKEVILNDEAFCFVQIEKTERAIRAEEGLDREKKRLEAFLRYASIGILISDISGRIVLSNPAAQEMLGYGEKELKGKMIEALLPSDKRAKHVLHRGDYVEHMKEQPMRSYLELSAWRKDNTELPVEISLGTYEADGESLVLFFLNDITVRRKAQTDFARLNEELEQKVSDRTRQLSDTMAELEKSREELRKMLEREKELSELKSRFVTMASHEFRTPLSTILSSLYLIEKYTSAEDQSKRMRHIERIATSVHSLTDILNDFLSVGKIEEGKQDVKFSVFRLPEAVNQVMHELEPNLKTGQKFHYMHKGAENACLDPSMLRYILTNLLVNAIKFSGEHKLIEIKSSITGNETEISISDEGIGIAREDQAHLFERFFRGRNAVNIQGTGLGLHIVARYTELMNGSIIFRSEIEKGSTFTLKFNPETTWDLQQ